MKYKSLEAHLTFHYLHFAVAQKYIYLMKVKVKFLSRVWLFTTPWTVCSPLGSSVHGVLQARMLEWVAISFSNAWKWKVKWSRSVVFHSYRPRGPQPTRLLHSWNFPCKSTAVDCHCLLQNTRYLSWNSGS